MIFRNGINTNIRARGRTALFFILITALTFSLVLSLGVLSYSGKIIDRCNDAYRSVGLLEYMGGDYPDENAADPFARAAAENVGAFFGKLPEGVEDWTETRSDIVFADGFTNKSTSSKYADYGVVVLSGIGDSVYRMTFDYLSIEDAVRELFGYEGGFTVTNDYLNNNNGTAFIVGGGYYVLTDDGDFYSLDGYGCDYDEDGNVVGVIIPREDKSAISYYSARVSEVLYAADFKANRLVNLIPGDLDFVPEKGKSYIAHGVFLPKNSVEPYNGIASFEVVSIKGYDGSPFALRDGTEPEIFAQTAELYNKLNNCLVLDSADDVNDLYEFHQGLVYAERGEIPSPEDRDSCIITPNIAYALDLSPGGEIHVTLLTSAEDSRYDLDVAPVQKTLRVAGITNWSDDFSGRIWAVGDGFGSPLFGYRLGTLRFDNASAQETAERISASLPSGVRLTVYDQGYSDAVRPLESIIATAADVAVVCSVGAVTVLLFFAFLFVGRQDGNVKIMVSLGTPRRSVAAWLLSGALLITASASLLGAAAGHFTLPVIYSAVTRTALSGADSPLLYSETAIGVRKTVELSAPRSVLPTLAAWAGMMLLSLAFCLIFMRRAYRAGTFDRGSSRVRVPSGRTSAAGRGSIRFAALSIKRGGMRSLIVPAVAAVLTVTVVFLSGMYQGWRNELDAAYNGMTITGNAVSTNGRWYSGLIISPENVRSLLALDNVDGVYVSKPFRYWIPSEEPPFSHTSFGMEQREDWIATQPDITAVNALAGAKDFYYSEPVVEWLDGWDESFLADDKYEPFLSHYRSGPKKAVAETGEVVYEFDDYTIPAVVGDGFAKAHGLKAGDDFSVTFLEDAFGYRSELGQSLKVVGIYKQTGRAQIYVPLAWALPPDALFGEYDPEEHPGPSYSYYNYYTPPTNYDPLDYYYYSQITLSTCRFTFTSASGLDEVRKTLYDAGFSRVGKLGRIRLTLVLNDADFVRLTETLGRYVTTGTVMMAVIAALVAVCGFVISWLLINGRKQEFALMRGFGANGKRIFASFFFEQALLCGAGTLIGAAAIPVFNAGGWLPPAAAAAFAVCYLAGCAVSVRMIGKTKLMELLSSKE